MLSYELSWRATGSDKLKSYKISNIEHDTNKGWSTEQPRRSPLSIKEISRMLTANEFKTWCAPIESVYPPLICVYGFVDGVKLRLQCSGDVLVRRIFYNGWEHDLYVGNLLKFFPMGTITACGLNEPSSMHDSKFPESNGLYERLEMLYGN